MRSAVLVEPVDRLDAPPVAQLAVNSPQQTAAHIGRSSGECFSTPLRWVMGSVMRLPREVIACLVRGTAAGSSPHPERKGKSHERP